MLTTIDNPKSTTTDFLIPPGLIHLASSLAPENRLKITMLDIKPKINGTIPELLASWLTEKEVEQFHCYSFEKRRNEWLSGRICAKQATLDLLNDNNAASYSALDFSIEATSAGKPFVQFANTDRAPSEQVEISISHSRGKAIGSAGFGLCGIDVQHLNDTLFKVRSRFCSDVEAAILDEIPVDEIIQLGLLWVAKEAVRKCLSSMRIVGFREIKLARVSELQGYKLLHVNLTADNFLPPEASSLSILTHHDKSFAVGICTAGRELIDA